MRFDAGHAPRGRSSNRRPHLQLWELEASRRWVMVSGGARRRVPECGVPTYRQAGWLPAVEGLNEVRDVVFAPSMGRSYFHLAGACNDALRVWRVELDPAGPAAGHSKWLVTEVFKEMTPTSRVVRRAAPRPRPRGSRWALTVVEHHWDAAGRVERRRRGPGVGRGP